MSESKEVIDFSYDLMAGDGIVKSRAETLKHKKKDSNLKDKDNKGVIVLSASDALSAKDDCTTPLKNNFLMQQD